MNTEHKEIIANLKLPKYLQGAITSPIAREGNYGFMEPEEWELIARGVYAHKKGLLDCGEDCHIGCTISSRLGVRNNLTGLLQEARDALVCDDYGIRKKAEFLGQAERYDVLIVPKGQEPL